MDVDEELPEIGFAGDADRPPTNKIISVHGLVVPVKSTKAQPLVKYDLGSEDEVDLVTPTTPPPGQSSALLASSSVTSPLNPLAQPAPREPVRAQDRGSTSRRHDPKEAHRLSVDMTHALDRPRKDNRAIGNSILDKSDVNKSDRLASQSLLDGYLSGDERSDDGFGSDEDDLNLIPPRPIQSRSRFGLLNDLNLPCCSRSLQQWEDKCVDRLSCCAQQ